MIVRSLWADERVVIACFLRTLQAAKDDPANIDCRNMIYDRVADRCGVTYDQVVDLCHNRLYLEARPGVYVNAWKGGLI